MGVAEIPSRVVPILYIGDAILRRTRDALDAYAQALELAPDSIEVAQAFARLQVRSGNADADTPDLLERIALRGSTAHWRDWARLQRAKQGK